MVRVVLCDEIFSCAHLHASACKYIALLFPHTWLAGLMFVIPRWGGEMERDEGRESGLWGGRQILMRVSDSLPLVSRVRC